MSDHSPFLKDNVELIGWYVVPVQPHTESYSERTNNSHHASVLIKTNPIEPLNLSYISRPHPQAFLTRQMSALAPNQSHQVMWLAVMHWGIPCTCRSQFALIFLLNLSVCYLTLTSMHTNHTTVVSRNREYCAQLVFPLRRCTNLQYP